MSTVAVGHVQIDERGIARIEGTRIKVIHLVMEKQANGWSPEELQRQFSHLSLAQVYAAFAYYHANREEMDRQIKEDFETAERLSVQAGESAISQRLRQSGKLP